MTKTDRAMIDRVEGDNMHASQEDGTKEGFDLVGMTVAISMSSLYEGYDRFFPGALRPSELERALSCKGIHIIPRSRAKIKREDGTRGWRSICDMDGVIDPADYDTVAAYSISLRRGRDFADVKIVPARHNKHSLYESINITLNTQPSKDKIPDRFVNDVVETIMNAYDSTRRDDTATQRKGTSCEQWSC